MNIFDDFDFTSWVSPDFLESTGLSGLNYGSVLAKLEYSPSMEASFALCWQQLDPHFELSNHSYDDILDRLSVLIAKNKPRIVPDPTYGDLDDVNAVTFVHLAVGNALLLEEVENRQSERFWELLDDALRIIKIRNEIGYELSDDYDFSPYMEKSQALVEELIYCKQFHRNFNERKYMQALDSLKEASRLASYTEFWDFGEECASALEVWDAGNNLLANIVPEQKAVDAFDYIYEEHSVTIDWGKLASYCNTFQRIYEDLSTESVYSSVLGESLNSWAFWPLARLLASQRISRDDLIETLRAMQGKEAEARLRLYFFRETWDSLPDKARASLISADREYENHGGRRPIIFDHLRHAARAIMVESLWKPYREFLRSKAADGLKDLSDVRQVRQIIEDDQTEPDLAPLVNAPHFEEFLNTVSEDTRFIKRLPDKLRDLNEWANKVSHQHHWGYKGFEGQLRETYAEFLGIGRNGILPRLMRLHPKDKPSSRR